MNKSKKAIIVGASSGIGKALARELVKNNYSVGITGRRDELLLKLQKEHPDSKSWYALIHLQSVKAFFIFIKNNENIKLVHMLLSQRNQSQFFYVLKEHFP